MSYTYTVVAGGNEYEVTISGDDDNAEIEEVSFKDKDFSAEGLYVKVPIRLDNYIERYTPLYDYLLEGAIILLCEEGGAAYQDSLAEADYRYDEAREEGA